jgi:hypothetical protein
MLNNRPERHEAKDYFFKYIDSVPDGDICAFLEAQGHETVALLRGIPDAQAGHRYAPDKWSISEAVGHVNDTERLFLGRAFWFARGFDSELPSFDQNVAVAAAASDAVPLRALVDEFAAVRASTVTFFRNLPDAAWIRMGKASGNPFSVRALAYLIAGHAAHHNALLRERYLATTTATAKEETHS